MGYGIVKLAEDAYVEWSTVVDAPVSDIHTLPEAVRRWGSDRVGRANLNGHSFKDYAPDHEYTSFNRAGPNKECLTVEAILRLYGPGSDDRQPLSPSDVRPAWTNWFLPDGRDADEDGPIYAWVPWRPGEAPDVMPPPERYREMWTRIGPDELSQLRGEVTP